MTLHKNYLDNTLVYDADRDCYAKVFDEWYDKFSYREKSITVYHNNKNGRGMLVEIIRGDEMIRIRTKSVNRLRLLASLMDIHI